MWLKGEDCGYLNSDHILELYITKDNELNAITPDERFYTLQTFKSKKDAEEMLRWIVNEMN